MGIKDFLGKDVYYDKTGQMIFANQKDGHQQLIINVRGWGAIQNHFRDENDNYDTEEATVFQDKLGEFIAEAINEKIKTL